MREQWGSSAGFVVATIGAAVGLGNIWRFAYVTGENGGAAFLLIYLGFVAVIGLPLMIAELALGRRAGADAVGAFERGEEHSPWRHAGWLGVLAAGLILSYYAVIAGWALRYVFGAATGGLWQANAEGFAADFESFIGHYLEPALWQAAMLAAAGIVVSAGIRGGIERLNRWLMPLLAVIVVLLAAFAITLPGGSRGVAFILAPDWGAFSRPAVYLNALGQAFFSLGLGMAVFITYGSYLGRGTSIPRAAVAVAVGDTAFAIVAGLAIFPAVFAFGGDPAAGPRLAFITLPQVFMQMPGGGAVGLVFFLLLSAAALTSMMSLLEVPVSVLVERTSVSRRAAVVFVTVAVFLAGLPAALGYGVLAHWTLGGLPILDLVDQTTSNVLLPLCGLAVAIFVGWRIAPATVLADADLATSRLGRIWLWLLRMVVPATILVILVRSLAWL